MSLTGARGRGFKDMAVKFWAALQPRVTVTSPVSLAPPIREENTLNDNDDGNIAHSPAVLELLDELRGARESDAVIAADLGQGESVMADLAAQRGRLEGQLRASEEALAASAALPEGPFSEEHEIHDVDRRIRVAKSRVSLLSARVAESRANIERLRKSLRGAFGQFITGRLTEVRARYRAAALALRDIYVEQMAWCETAFVAQVQVPGPDVAVIADSEPIDNRRELLDSRDMRRPNVWRKFSGPLSVRLTALHADVTAAIGETKAPRGSTPATASRAPAPKQQSFESGSMETFLGMVQETGLGGGSGSPADRETQPVLSQEVLDAAGADVGALPDLGPHGI